LSPKLDGETFEAIVTVVAAGFTTTVSGLELLGGAAVPPPVKSAKTAC